MSTPPLGPPAQAVAVHGGGTLPVWVDGTDTASDPLLLLHGFPGGPATWSRVVERMAGRTAGRGRRLLVVEQRGYAATARSPHVSAYRIEQLVEDASTVIDACAGDRVHLVGHDWGGVVAWHLAALRPEQVASLFVLSTPHPHAYRRAATTSTQALRSSYALGFQMPFVPEAALTVRGGALLRAMLRGSGLDADMADRYAQDMRAPGRMRAALHWYRAAARHWSATSAPMPTGVPTTYVWGDADPALGRRAAEGTATEVAGRYRFRPLAGLGHWLPECAPDRVAEELDAHLDWVLEG